MLALKQVFDQQQQQQKNSPTEKKVKHSADRVVRSGSKLARGGHAGLLNGVYVVGKATMSLFDLSAGSDQF